MSEFPIPEELRASHWNWDKKIRESMSEDLAGIFDNYVGALDNKEKFAAALRDNRQLKYLALWTGYTTQNLLDSVCAMTNLERLEFGHLRAADISGLAKLENLQYLSIVSLSSATSLKPLTGLRNLISLGLGISKKITSLEDFSVNFLANLRALHLGESSERVVTVDSLKPLGALKALEYVAIGRIRTQDRSLAGFLKLPSLKALEIDKNARFSSADIESLASNGVKVTTF